MKNIYKISSIKKQYSLRLRSNPTQAEEVLWNRLRGRQVEGKTFTRQKVILGYIIDFYCISNKLAIEVNGFHHYSSSENKRSDAIRTNILAGVGITVIRFTNTQVLKETNQVVESIKMYLGLTEPIKKSGTDV